MSSTKVGPSSTIYCKWQSVDAYFQIDFIGDKIKVLDLKEKIVLVKKLDRGTNDFDLNLRNDETNVEYTDDNEFVMKSSHIIVGKVFAKRHGLLARLRQKEAASGSSTYVFLLTDKQ